MVSFGEIVDRVYSAKEEFALDIRSGVAVRTNDDDATRVDYPVNGPYGRTDAVELDVTSPTFRQDLEDFVMANRETLASRYLHVMPHGHVRDVGVSDFSNQPQKEMERSGTRRPVDLSFIGRPSVRSGEDFGMEL